MSQFSTAAHPALATQRNGRVTRPDADLPWQVRLEWESQAPVVHPHYTYEGRNHEADALFSAQCALRWERNANPRVTAAYVRGPADEDWRRITMTDPVPR